MEEEAKAWSHPSILDFFEKNRSKTQDIYPSEWFFIGPRLFNGMHILDIGCAKGGMVNVLREHLVNFHYTGIDINADMIEAAKKRYPEHQFHQVKTSDYSILGLSRYDVVLCLGILHLHAAWRHTIAEAWQYTKTLRDDRFAASSGQAGHLILDLRESYLPTIEDKEIAYFKMDFGPSDQESAHATLPYNIINTSHALQTISTICNGADQIRHYGYSHAVSSFAVTPLSNVMINVYCIKRSI